MIGSRSAARNMCSVRHRPMPCAPRIAALAGVALGVGVGAHLDVAGGDRVGPRQQRLELGRRLGARRVERRPRYTLPVLPSIVISSPASQHRAAPMRTASPSMCDLAGADDGRDPPPAGDDRGVADHAAAGGEDAARRLHAEHVVGRGLGTHEDHRLAAVAGLHRRVGGEHDAPLAAPGRGRQAGGDRLGVDVVGEAGVEELGQVVGPDRVDRRGDRGAGADRRPRRWTAAVIRCARSPLMPGETSHAQARAPHRTSRTAERSNATLRHAAASSSGLTSLQNRSIVRLASSNVMSPIGIWSTM